MKHLLMSSLCALLASASVSVVKAGDVAENEAVEDRSLAEMSQVERDILAAKMEIAVNEVTMRGGFFEDDPLPVHVSVKIDHVKNYVYLDFDERLGPKSDSPEMEDLGDSLRFTLEIFTDHIRGGVVLAHLYGGKSSGYWYPELEDGARVPIERRGADEELRNSVVSISPGHGLYYHHGFNDWRAHRDTVNGVLEDDATPKMAAYLVRELQRDGLTVHNFRDASDLSIHRDSNQPWWRQGVRYHLERSIPNHPEIWNSLADSKDADRERREDLRSRPLYANYLKSGAFIHVHTNAHARESVRGARLIVHPRDADKRLGEKILCGMRELIHSNERYASYPVPVSPNEVPNKAENKLANMPSAIVEVGFHTNKADAQLLQDAEFQKLAMVGVAKGYRLYREGRACADLAFDPVDPAEGFVGRDVFMPVTLRGNPTYPVRVTYKVTNCATKWCSERTVSLYNAKEVAKHRVQYLCKRSDLGRDPISIQLLARDYDGVRAKPQTYTVTCKE